MADSLISGILINIKRSNGRVQNAYVSSVDFQSKIVNVEWFEDGETKGKEVDILTLAALNPNLIVDLPTLDTNAQEPSVPTAPIRLKRCDSRQIIAPRFSAAHKGVNNRLTNLNTALQLNEQPLSPNHNTSFRRAKTINNIPLNKIQQTLSTAPIAMSGTAPPMSNVVKQVEKLKKNREERRQRLADERAEREAFLQLAPGNPHWDFLNMIMDYRRSVDIRPMVPTDPIEDHTITVCVRKRPLNIKEIKRKEVDVITIPSKKQLIVHEPKNKVDLTKFLENQVFKFDYAFNETCDNEMVYRYTAQPLVKTIFEGGFATCFAYGQTGSGKTHTMGGTFSGKNQDAQSGIYAYVATDVFTMANLPQFRSEDLVVKAAFFELYTDKVFDLLNRRNKLRVLENGKQNVVVVGLTEMIVTSTEEVLELIRKGSQARTSGQTHANANSSRSHAVFQIILKRLSNKGQEEVCGKFSLVDLAGNERGADTLSADRATRMESAEINKSLLALKECIRALGRKGGHLPFRVSKLTLVLRDSFVGANSRTCMIAMVSPGMGSCEHTLNTLRYANRVKELGAGDLVPGIAREPNDDDDDDDGGGELDQLRSLSEPDMTPEILKFHQMIRELQQCEEEVLDHHRELVEQLKEATALAEQILKPTEDVQYDQEVYCNAFSDFISNMMKVVGRAGEKVAEYKEKLQLEEQLSRRRQL